VGSAGWLGKAISVVSPDIISPNTSPDEIFVVVASKVGKWTISRQSRFYCHVGQIYVMNVSSMPFENIPSISELISTGTASKSDRNPSDAVFELPTLKGNGHLAHETPAPQLQETL